MTGRKNKKGAGRPPLPNPGKRHNIYTLPHVWEYLNQSGNASEMIRKLVEDKMNSKTNLTYAELEQAMIWKGFTRAEIDTLTNWWGAENWDWLNTASAQEIREASKDALE